MSELGSIFKKAGFTVISGILGKFLSLATLILVTRFFETSTYGSYILYLSYVTVASAIFPAFLGVVFTVEQTKQKSHFNITNLKKLQAEALTFTCLLLSIITGISFLLAPNFIDNQSLINSLIALLCLRGFNTYFISVLRANDQFYALAITATIEIIIKLLTVIYIIFELGLATSEINDHITWLITADAIAALSTLLISILFALRQTWRPVFKLLGTSSSFLSLYKAQGKWQIARILIVNLNAQLRLWIIALILSPAAVGIFSIAQRLFQFAKIFMPIQPILTTFFSQKINSEFLQKNVRLVLSVFNSIALCFTVLGIIACIILPQFLFPQYSQQLSIIAPILMVTLLFKGVSYVISSLLDSLHEQRTIFFSNLCATLYLFVILAPSTYFFGLIGAAIACSFNVCSLLFQLYVVKRSDLIGEVTYRDFVHFDFSFIRKYLTQR